jgi:hypothetical protein
MTRQHRLRQRLANRLVALVKAVAETVKAQARGHAVEPRMAALNAQAARLCESWARLVAEGDRQDEARPYTKRKRT